MELTHSKTGVLANERQVNFDETRPDSTDSEFTSDGI